MANLCLELVVDNLTYLANTSELVQSGWLQVNLYSDCLWLEIENLFVLIYTRRYKSTINLMVVQFFYNYQYLSDSSLRADNRRHLSTFFHSSLRVQQASYGLQTGRFGFHKNQNRPVIFRFGSGSGLDI